MSTDSHLKSIYLHLRRGTYYVRVDVPEGLQDLVGQKVFKKSLKTGSLQQAEKLKAPYVALWFRRIEEAKQKQASGDWQAQAQATGYEIAERQKESVLVEAGLAKPESITPEEAATLPSLYAEVVAEGTLREEDAAALYQLHLSLMEAYRYASSLEEKIRFRKELAKLDGYFETLKLGKLYGLSDSQQRDILKIIDDPELFKPKSPFDSSRLTKFAAYRADIKGVKSASIKQQLSRIKTIGKFLEVNGLPLDHDSVALFLESLDLSPETKNQYLLAGRSFWKWAIKRDLNWKETYKGRASPFDDHDLPFTSNSPTAGGYTPFTHEGIKRLHDAALERGDSDLADLIAIATYTGCRMEEIGRIHRDLVIFVEGHPFSFKVEEAKTEAGKRELPIHEDIAPIFERRLAASNDGYIFYGRASDKRGRRINAIGKRFNTLKENLGYGPKEVFHSIRKTFTDTLRHAGVDHYTIKYLDGHKVKDVTYGVYSTGPSLEQKLEAIRKLKFPLKI